MMTWQPLLDASALAPAHAVADALATAAWDDEPPPGARPDADAGRVDLARGRAGGAVLLHALGRTGAAVELLQQTIELLDTCGPGLHTGYTGIAWLADRLGVGDELCDQVDGALAELLSTWSGGLDVIDGLVGIGAYLLARGDLGGVARVVERLAGAEIRDKHGSTWIDDHGLVDFGMAHGNAGIIAFLARAAAAGIGDARSLLVDATTWLLAHDDPDAEVRFPGKLAPDGRRYHARHGWCYGDLGIAVALDAAGRAAQRDDWRATALSVAHAAAALPRDASSIRDATLCHGTAGVAHMFARLHAETGDAICASAARCYLAATLEHSADGFCARDAAGYTRRSPGLLAGAAGAALVLASAASATPPTWDALFLV